MVRQWQELFYKKRYSHTCITGPDFVKLAEAYGAVGLRALQEPQGDALGAARPHARQAFQLADQGFDGLWKIGEGHWKTADFVSV